MRTSKISMSRWGGTVVLSILCGFISSFIFGFIVDDLRLSLSFFIAIFILLLFGLAELDIFSVKFIRRVFNRETILDWEDLTLGALFINERLLQTGYTPTHIVGIGRGGAILSALISGNLIETKHVPFSVFERKYSKDKTGMRQAEVLEGIELGACDLSKVLLVAGDVVTGITAQRFKEFLIDKGAKEIRFAVLAMCPNSAMKPDYFYKSFETEKGLYFPWMLCSNYTRYCIQDGVDCKV